MIHLVFVRLCLELMLHVQPPEPVNLMWDVKMQPNIPVEIHRRLLDVILSLSDV